MPSAPPTSASPTWPDEVVVGIPGNVVDLVNDFVGIADVAVDVYDSSSADFSIFDHVHYFAQRRVNDESTTS